MLSDMCKPEKTLRVRLIGAYPKFVANEHFQPSETSPAKFTATVAKWLRYANTPYASKENKGLYYAEDYIARAGENEKVSSIIGLSHPHFWDIDTHSCLFKALEGQLPSHALTAFFRGPTFAECASTLQACVYRAIEEMIGTDAFDQLFGTSLARFMITPILFDKIHSESEYPQYDLEFRQFAGNPLFFLFDKTDHFSESDVQEGDIIYIKGVENYAQKHLAGAGSGWNVICVGRNDSGQNLYLGFGPDSFPKPMTLQEIKAILIKHYNAEQLVDTRDMIERFGAESTDSHAIDSHLNKAKAHLAAALANDKVDENYPIVGPQFLIRLNPAKLQHFLSQQHGAWHSEAFDATHFDSNTSTSSLTIKQIATISTETHGKSFADFQAETTTQQQLLSLSKQFAVEVCRGDRQVPAGFVMTGLAGLGKTHLAVAVGRYASLHGRNVLFVDENIVVNLYQKMGEESDSASSMTKMHAIFKDWLQQADLIIIDDINSKYSIAADFLKLAIDYVMRHNKAIIITANQPMLSIKDYLPDYIGYDDPLAQCFNIVQDIQGTSYRKTWWTDATVYSSSGNAESNQDALEILAGFSGNQPAGIVIEEQDIDLSLIAQQYARFAPGTRIRILAEPSRNDFVYDMYIHDADQHDVFIIKLNQDFDQCKQLLGLISHVHDLGKKLIVVTDTEDRLFADIREKLSRYGEYRKKIQRLNDRINHLLLRKTNWQNLHVAANSTRGILIDHTRQPVIQVGPTRPPKVHTRRSSRLDYGFNMSEQPDIYGSQRLFASPNMGRQIQSSTKQRKVGGSCHIM